MISGFGAENHPNGGRPAPGAGPRLRAYQGGNAMRKIVLRFGLLSGVILLADSAVLLPLCMKGIVNFEHNEVIGAVGGLKKDIVEKP